MQKFVYIFTVALLLVSCEKRQQTFAPQSFEELRGHNVCVLEGSFQQGYAMEHQQEYGYNLIFLPSATDCMLALRNNKADVVFGAEMYSFNSAFRRSHLKVCHVIKEISVPVALGIRLDDKELVDDIDAFQDSLAQCGAMKTLIERWFTKARQDNDDFHSCVKFPPVASSTHMISKSGNPEIRKSGNPDSRSFLRVGVAGMIPPAEVLIDNKWTGCEIELLQRYALSRGLQLQLFCYDFNNLMPALQTGKIDVIAAALVISDEREQKIAFTKPYTELNAAFIISDEHASSKSPLSYFSSLLSTLQESFYYSFLAENRWKMLVEGLKTTIIISFFSLLLGAILGAFICWLRMNRRRTLRKIGHLYVSIMRNMPMLVFLMMMFYVFLADSGLPAVTIAIIAFGINSAAYLCEIYRTGIQSIDRGQTEAGYALGFSPLQTFLYIVAPQAARKALPVCKSEVVTLIKGTSIAGYISIIDLTKASDLIRSSSFEAFFPLLLVTIAYFILAWLFTTVIDYLIRHL